MSDEMIKELDSFLESACRAGRIFERDVIKSDIEKIYKDYLVRSSGSSYEDDKSLFHAFYFDIMCYLIGTPCMKLGQKINDRS